MGFPIIYIWSILVSFCGFRAGRTLMIRVSRSGFQLRQSWHLGLRILHGGSCPAHCSMLNCIPDLYPLDVSGKATPLWQLNMSPDSTKCLLGQNCTLTSLWESLVSCLPKYAPGTPWRTTTLEGLGNSRKRKICGQTCLGEPYLNNNERLPELFMCWLMWMAKMRKATCLYLFDCWPVSWGSLQDVKHFHSADPTVSLSRWGKGGYVTSQRLHTN